MTVKPARKPGPSAVASRYLAIATVAAAISFTASAADAAGLFEPLPAGESASVQGPPVSAYAVRDQLVRIDRGYMESRLVPSGIDKARDRVRRAPDAGPVLVELFPDLSVTIDRDSLEKSGGGDGGYIWSGSTRDGDGGFAVFVIARDQITGQIQIGNRLFRIEPVADNVHRISELDSGKFPPERSVPAPLQQSAPVPDAGPEANPEAKKTKIRVLIPYTNKAKNQVANVVSEARLAIKLANLAAKNGGVSIKYVLAGTLLVKGYKEKQDSFEKDLTKLADGKGKFKNVHTTRNQKKADLVALLRNDGQYCGLGYYVPSPTTSSSNYGFTVTSIGCISNHSVAHEMGHNSGLDHDRYVVSPTPPNSEYNFGYVNLPAKIRSVMAYDNECYDSGFNCTRVPMFSTPLKKYKGKKIGVAAGSPGAADAARRLNETRAAIASYR